MIKSVGKVKIIVPKEKREELLLMLQKEQIVMLPTREDLSDVEIAFEEEIISRANNAIKKLGTYSRKNRKFFQHHQVSYEDFVNHMDERIAYLEQLEKQFDQLNFLSSEIRDEQKMISEVVAYRGLKYSTKELSDSLYVEFFTGYVPENRWDFFRSYCEKDNVSYSEYSQSEIGHHILVYLDSETADKQSKQLKRFGFVDVELPILTEKLETYINKKQKIIDNNTKEIQKIEKALSNAGEIENQLKILVDQMLSQIERKKIYYKEDESDVSFDGWVSVEKSGELQGIVKKVTLEYQLEFDNPNEFDNVPTLLENNKFVQPFESITNTYSVPNYREVDPNPVMSIWYWLIFGIMVGDVGYGILMLIGFGLFWKYKKPKGEFGELVKILFYNGITAIISGLVFSSFFGVELPYKGLINPTGDPMSMLFFSIGLGIVHLITALTMKVILSIKQKKYIEGVADGVSWILILLGLALFAINMALKLGDGFKNLAIIVAITGVVLLFVFSGLKKKGIFGKIFGGFGGLFGVTSYLSDVLSYSRILALVLSSGIIATTMNLLAGLLQGSAWIFPFSILVYIVGHLFNFVMGLLSAYVHTGRLQYLEFYGKFFEGGGYLFVPLRFNMKYMNEISS